MSAIASWVPKWDYLSWARDRFGVATALRTYPSALMGIARVPAGAGTVGLRVGSADFCVYDDVFIHGEYNVDLGIRDDPKVIIDAGAHVGLASVYLAERYPNARIFAIEPNRGNFAMLQRNVARFPHVHPIYAGLWWRMTHLQIEDEHMDTWSYRVREGGSIPTVTVADLLMEAGQPIHLLKMDIEGAEREVLKHSASWMPEVRVLIIETHDRFAPGCTAILDRAIAGQGFTGTQSGEKWVFRRREATAS